MKGRPRGALGCLNNLHRTRGGAAAQGLSRRKQIGYDAGAQSGRASMSSTKNCAAAWQFEIAELLPNLDELVTEDGKPIANSYVEKLSKLLIDPLFSSWQPSGEPGRPF